MFSTLKKTIVAEMLNTSTDRALMHARKKPILEEARGTKLIQMPGMWAVVILLVGCSNSSWVDVNPPVGCSAEVLPLLSKSEPIIGVATKNCQATGKSFAGDLRCDGAKLQAACK